MIFENFQIFQKEGGKIRIYPGPGPWPLWPWALALFRFGPLGPWAHCLISALSALWALALALGPGPGALGPFGPISALLFRPFGPIWALWPFIFGPLSPLFWARWALFHSPPHSYQQMLGLLV